MNSKFGCPNEFFQKINLGPLVPVQDSIIDLPALVVKRKTGLFTQINISITDNGYKYEIEDITQTRRIKDRLKYLEEYVMYRQNETMNSILRTYEKKLDQFRKDWYIHWMAAEGCLRCITKNKGDLVLNDIIEASDEFKGALKLLAKGCALNPDNDEHIYCLLAVILFKWEVQTIKPELGSSLAAWLLKNNFTKTEDFEDRIEQLLAGYNGVILFCFPPAHIILHFKNDNTRYLKIDPWVDGIEYQHIMNMIRYEMRPPKGAKIVSTIIKQGKELLIPEEIKLELSDAIFWQIPLHTPKRDDRPHFNQIKKKQTDVYGKNKRSRYRPVSKNTINAIKQHEGLAGETKKSIKEIAEQKSMDGNPDDVVTNDVVSKQIKRFKKQSRI